MICNANLKLPRPNPLGCFKLSFFLDRKNAKKRYTAGYFYYLIAKIRKNESHQGDQIQMVSRDNDVASPLNTIQNHITTREKGLWRIINF